MEKTPEVIPTPSLDNLVRAWSLLRELCLVSRWDFLGTSSCDILSHLILRSTLACSWSIPAFPDILQVSLSTVPLQLHPSNLQLQGRSQSHRCSSSSFFVLFSQDKIKNPDSFSSFPSVLNAGFWNSPGGYKKNAELIWIKQSFPKESSLEKCAFWSYKGLIPDSFYLE